MWLDFPTSLICGYLRFKKNPAVILCAGNTSRSNEKSARNANHAVRMCERFVYSIERQNNKIVKNGDIFWEIHEVHKDLRAFFLDCAFQSLIGWAGKLPSHRSLSHETISKSIQIQFIVNFIDRRTCLWSFTNIHSTCHVLFFIPSSCHRIFESWFLLQLAAVWIWQDSISLEADCTCLTPSRSVLACQVNNNDDNRLVQHERYNLAATGLNFISYKTMFWMDRQLHPLPQLSAHQKHLMKLNTF